MKNGKSSKNWQLGNNIVLTENLLNLIKKLMLTLAYNAFFHQIQYRIYQKTVVGKFCIAVCGQDLILVLGLPAKRSLKALPQYIGAGMHIDLRCV